MNEPGALGYAALSGIVLGAVFFGGLWWTTGRCLYSGRPALCFLCSMWLRTVTVLAGFYFMPGDSSLKWPVSLAGFAASRLIATRLAARWPDAPGTLAQGAKHAS